MGEFCVVSEVELEVELDDEFVDVCLGDSGPHNPQVIKNVVTHDVSRNISPLFNMNL